MIDESQENDFISDSDEDQENDLMNDSDEVNEDFLNSIHFFVKFDDTKNILMTDELDLNCYFVPVGSNMTIDIKEAYILNE